MATAPPANTFGARWGRRVDWLIANIGKIIFVILVAILIYYYGKYNGSTVVETKTITVEPSDYRGLKNTISSLESERATLIREKEELQKKLNETEPAKAKPSPNVTIEDKDSENSTSLRNVESKESEDLRWFREAEGR